MTILKSHLQNFLLLVIAPILFFSCSKKPFNIISDIDFSYYFSEAYNEKFYKNPIKFYTHSHSIPNNTISNAAHILISSLFPNKENKEKLRNIPHTKEKSIVNLYDPKVSLLAFSVPLIVSLKSSKAPMPDNKTVTISKLAQLIQVYSTNIENNTWAFPLKPHAQFKTIFPNDSMYNTWLKSITFSDEDKNDKENALEIFVTRYNDVPFLAIIQDANIAYKFIPSHIFFENPRSFRNLFSVAILTDDAGMVPIVSPVFMTIPKNNRWWSQLYKTNKVARWISKAKNQRYTFSFMENLFKDITINTQFLNRSYSNNKAFTSLHLLPRNTWLSEYGPSFDLLYFAR